MDWQHLFGRFREGQPRLPELDRRHVAQRRVDPEVVVPVHVVRELGPELARRAERLAVDELGLQYPVGRLVDGVVVGQPLADSDLSMPKASSIRSISALSNSLPRSVWKTSMSEMGREGVANAGLTGRASFPDPAEWPTVSLLQGSMSRQAQFHEAPSSMICCLAARNHMTRRRPCSAMRLSICERNYASLAVPQKSRAGRIAGPKKCPHPLPCSKD